MEEHKFPFDLDTDLRRHVKLEVERETVKLKASEIRRRLFPLTLWFLMLFIFGIVGTTGFFSRPSRGLISLLFAASVSLLFNFRRMQEVISLWHEMVNAKRQSRSWDHVAEDYRKTINKQDDPGKH